MAKRTSSRQFVTVFVSLILSFGVKAADLTIGKKIAWCRFNSEPEVVTAIASGDVQIGNLGSSSLAAAA